MGFSGRVLFFLSVILVLFLLASLLWRYELGPLPGGSDELVSFRIEKGESSASIAKRLQKASLVHSDLVFRLYLRFTNRGLQAGDYRLSSKMSLPEIVDKFQHGTFNVRLTIPEGLRKEEVARLINSKFKIQNSKLETEFLENLKSNQFAFEFLHDRPPTADLEGFLFPDTYLMPQDIQVTDLINLFLTNFNRKLDAKLQDDLKKQNLTIFEAVTLASIVEREAKFSYDRPLIAGILLKRLRNNWPLEADATVQYAKTNKLCLLDQTGAFLPSSDCDWWPQEITGEDLKIDSAYNTRRSPGLPPGPISNPGLDSLKAVIYPQDSPFWFYFSKKTGEIVYSETFNQHLTKLNLDSPSPRLQGVDRE